MQNWILTLFISLSLCSSFAQVEGLQWPYRLASDSLNTAIPSGKYRIKGKMIYDNQRIKLLTIQSQNTKTVTTQTDTFTLELDTNDRYIVVNFNRQMVYVEGLPIQSQHEYEVEIDLISVEKGVEIRLEKPVIYLYADKKTKVNLQLNTTQELSFTYPKISASNSWDFSCDGSGELILAGKKYPYLFWEAKTNHFEFKRKEGKTPGELVHKDSIVDFLEQRLDQLHFNSREKTDFITYWAPKMSENNYVFMQFLIDEAYDEIATIQTTPKLDGARRVFLLYRGFDVKPVLMNTEKQQFPSFSRKGFYLLEWGGSQLSTSEL